MRQGLLSPITPSSSSMPFQKDLHFTSFSELAGWSGYLAPVPSKCLIAYPSLSAFPKVHRVSNNHNGWCSQEWTLPPYIVADAQHSTTLQRKSTQYSMILELYLHHVWLANIVLVNVPILLYCIQVQSNLRFSRSRSLAMANIEPLPKCLLVQTWSVSSSSTRITILSLHQQVKLFRLPIGPDARSKSWNRGELNYSVEEQLCQKVKRKSHQWMGWM